MTVTKKMSDVLYIGIELTEKSKEYLRQCFEDTPRPRRVTHGDHVTIEYYLYLTPEQYQWAVKNEGEYVKMSSLHYGETDRVLAIFIDSLSIPIPVNPGKRLHITVSVKPGGSPRDSNSIPDGLIKRSIPLNLFGRVKIWWKK